MEGDRGSQKSRCNPYLTNIRFPQSKNPTEEKGLGDGPGVRSGLVWSSLLCS